MNSIKIFLFAVLLYVTASAQEYKTLRDDMTGETMFIGLVKSDVFNDSAFAVWFTPEYNSYKPDSAALQDAAAQINNADITIVMGSWCEDSRREVPRLFKILDFVSYPKEKITIIGVDRDKKVPLGDQSSKEDISSLDIKFVPTIIFANATGELGRIIEMPNESLEKDIVNILSK